MPAGGEDLLEETNSVRERRLDPGLSGAVHLPVLLPVLHLALLLFLSSGTGAGHIGPGSLWSDHNWLSRITSLTSLLNITDT